MVFVPKSLHTGGRIYKGSDSTYLSRLRWKWKEIFEERKKRTWGQEDWPRRKEPRRWRTYKNKHRGGFLNFTKGLEFFFFFFIDLEDLEVWKALKVWEFESLKSLKIRKVGKITPLGALYRGRNWVGVILLKIWGETPAVGSTSHRRMRGTKHCLEYLMKHCGL